MVKIMFNKSRERSSLRGKLLCLAMAVLMTISFTPLHVFAAAEAANDSGDLDDYGTEAYWKEYFHVDNIKYFDDYIESRFEFDNGVLLDDCYDRGCGKGVYFIKENHSNDLQPIGTPISILGDVTLIFVKTSENPNGPTVTVKGENASGSEGACPGIKLTEGNSLLVKGIGTLNATGGKAAGGEVGHNGYDGDNRESSEPDEMKAGEGGDGGAGGGGAGAGIGTGGSNGGESVHTEKNTYEKTWSLSHFTRLGVESVNGKDSEASTNAGVFKQAGNVKVNAVGGEEGQPSQKYSESGKHAKTSHMAGGSYFDVGGGGGGGNGGSGFAGADIGSGGVGGGSGGTGGSGGYTDSCYGSTYGHGGGGGGGAGSNTSLGGHANNEISHLDKAAYNGDDGGSIKGYPFNGPGGSGAGVWTDDEHKAFCSYGVTGGQGGFLNKSGGGGTSYSVCQGRDKNSPYFDGKPAKIQKAFPMDECKVVFTDSVKDNVYKYTGKPVHPSVKVVHVPTNTVVDERAYSVIFGENTNPKAGENGSYVEIKSTGMGDHDLFMDKTMTKAEGSIIVPIEIK